ncbi:hypothetical protein V2J09_008351 [Rumex salicifolius]
MAMELKLLKEEAKESKEERRSSSEAMRFNRLISIPIFSVLTVMSLVYYITIFIFLRDLVDLNSSVGSLNVIVFTFFGALSLFSFFVSVLNDPGRIPSNYIPDVEGDQSSSQGIDNSAVLQSRRCAKCSSYKPPRAHHCRTCRSCILKMDHHCVWINNCVGYRNYKAFVLLLLYGSVGSTYSMVIFLRNTLQRDWIGIGQNTNLKCFYVAYGVGIVGLWITLVTLLGWHIYLLSHNMTTIEYYEALRCAWLARKTGQSYRHPFDVGIYKNITAILGPNMLIWLFPTATNHLKDGTGFRVSRDT